MPNENTVPSNEAEQVSCYDCEAMIAEHEQYIGGDAKTRCKKCDDEYHTEKCERCGDEYDREDMYHYEHGYDVVCTRCYDTLECEEDVNVERKYSTENNADYQSDDAGTVIKSRRYFSAELECIYPSNRALQEAVKAMPKSYGVSYDGSLRGSGIEFQTPKLQGAKGEESLRAVCKMLNAKKFSTNASCGLHIHLDGAGLLPSYSAGKPRAARNLLAFYIAYEDVLLSLLPPSRRSNQYCRSVREEYASNTILGASTLARLEKIWYGARTQVQVDDAKEGKYHPTRYYGVNYHSLLKDGHLEIRYHSGTINAEKILRWIHLHQSIVDYAMRSYQVETASAFTTTSIKEKTAMLFNRIGLDDASREYFTARQKLFGEDAREMSEENATSINEQEVCAE